MPGKRKFIILAGVSALLLTAALISAAVVPSNNTAYTAGTTNKENIKTALPVQLRADEYMVKSGAKTLKSIISEKGIDASNGGISIIVDKSDHVLEIFLNDVFLKSYHVELGDSGLGDKNIEGDHKTPEGNFYISEKSVLNPPDRYLGSRWLRISYPNVEDADRGVKNGLIDEAVHDEIVSAFNNKITTPQSTALGGGVGIHGGSTEELGKDWTWGCVGLKNADIEDFFDYIRVGTPLRIQN